MGHYSEEREQQDFETAEKEREVARQLAREYEEEQKADNFTSNQFRGV